MKPASKEDQKTLTPAKPKQRKKQKFEPYKVRLGGRVMWQVNLESETINRHGRSVRIRPRRTFSRVEDARTFAELKRIERKNRGTLAVSMPERLRVDALEAAEILRPFGVSLTQVAREYAGRRELSHKSEIVQNAVASFLTAKEAEGMRTRYLQDLRSRLGRFARDFAEHKVSDITSGELDAWLRDLCLAPLGRNTYHLRIHTLFEYCRTRGWVTTNPLEGVPRARVAQDGPVGILSVDQTARLLENADCSTLPYSDVDRLYQKSEFRVCAGLELFSEP
jgi:hypothetical protein